LQRSFYPHSFRPNTLSENAYLRAIALFTLIMGLIVAGGVRISYHWPPGWILLLLCFAGSLVGIGIFKGSEQPVISFVGVSFMSACLGMMMGPLFIHYKGGTILKAVVITTAIMVAMSLVGILVPQLCRSWGIYLMGGLITLLVAQFGQIFFMSLGFDMSSTLPFTDWIGIELFTLFIGYDWATALEQDYTWDNAIDASGGLILDAVNILIRILSRSKSK